MKRRHALKWTILVVLVAAFAWFANHYVPLQPLVVTLYVGLGFALAGLVSLVRPLRFLAIRSRRRAFLVTAVGAALVLVAVSWPASTTHASGARQRIDDFLPDYEFSEYHEAMVAAAPERVARAVKEVRFTDLPVAVALMRVRAMAGGHFEAPRPSRKPILELFATPGSGFLPLDATHASEYVGGMVGRPWAPGPPPRVRTAEDFLAFHEPGNVKVAFNLRWSDAGGGRTWLTTETRIAATDAAARRTFARYWRLIYPGSAIIRRAWLDAVVDLAERPAPRP